MKRTYEYINHKGQTGFKCLKCKRTSFHPKDLENRYCGNCHIFYDEYVPSRFQIWWMNHGAELCLTLVMTAFYAPLIVFQARHNQIWVALGLTYFNIIVFGSYRESVGQKKMAREFHEHQYRMASTLNAVIKKAEGQDEG